MIVLRELSKRDLTTINKWRNDRGLVQMLGTTYRFINPETDEIWFENYLKNRSNEVRCAICLETSETIIGVVYLLHVDSISHNAEFAIMIGDKENRNKGFGSLATNQMLEYGFYHLNLHRIYLHVLEMNQGAIDMYEKKGFSREGIMKEAIYKNGHYENVVIMGLLKNVWEGTKS